MKRGLLLLLLLVPSAAAFEVLDARATMVYQPDIRDYVPVDVVNNQCPGQSPPPDVVSQPAEQRPRFQLNHREDTLRFHDPPDAQACGEARFMVVLPKAATTMELSFTADRQAATQGEQVAQIQQSVRFYNVDPGDTEATADELITCFSEYAYIGSDATIQAPEAYLHTVDLTDPTCDRITNRIVVAFYFGDELPQATAAGLSANARAGQWFQASLTNIELRFPDLGLDVSADRHDELDPEGDYIGYFAAEVKVPPSPSMVVPNAGEIITYERTVTFSVSNAYSIHRFYAGTVREGESQGTNTFRAEERDGQLYFTIPADVVRQHDRRGDSPVPFAVTFYGDAASKVSLGMMPLAGLAVLAPLAFGVIAQRNVNHLHRAARGRLRTIRWSLQGVLAGGWALYLTVAFVLLITINGVGMAAWPIPPRNVVAYVALAVTSFIMVAAAVASRRSEMGLVVQDFTELERIQVELQRSNQELEQFAYVASHDLKEPLRMVAGFTQLLEAHLDEDLDDEGRRYLGFASEGASRLQRMVDDLLAYSRVRHDKAAVRLVALDDVMVIVRGHLQKLLEERNVRLEVGTLPKVMADQGQLVQVLLNLVQNAVKFSPQDNPLVEVTATRRGGMVHIAVRDEGIGIDEAQQDRIFQIFQRLHLREDYEGNGIGLAMVKKIAEQAGGRVTVASSKGKGSTFTVSLPDLVPPSGPIRPAANARAA